ncbi:MAG: hypothetical protein AAFV87_14320 [Pseudomonadota bacterium]
MTKKRFISMWLEASKASEVKLPWTRGTTRTAFIAKRRLALATARKAG